MAYTYYKTIKVSVRDSCGMMGDEKSEEYIARVVNGALGYIHTTYPGVAFEIIDKGCDG